MTNPTASGRFLLIARCAGLLIGTMILSARGAGAELTIDARLAPQAPEALAFPIGGRSPSGQVFAANSRYLTLDGQPWFPVMGEFHYSRYPAAEWEPEILKMKAGGISVVATYVFWLHHEETEGRFDWAGQRDLRRFVELCAGHGLKVWVRIGPWCHGEARNGGFPDWLLQLGPTRTNHPAYLERVQRFFGEIGRQLHGLYWQDGGPIVGVQLENEYHPATDGLEHMQKLHELAQAAGIVAPFLTATGWDRAVVPPAGFLPVFGGYTDNFWSTSRGELPPSQHFFFTAIRAEDNVMGDLTPKNPGYNTKYEDYPFLTAEMGGGMSVAYHRRPVMFAADSTAAALVKLGDGIAGLGYYMYHGGTNPASLAPLQETQAGWNGYNDMEVKSYDFQAPLGEFGQVNPTFRTLRVLHLFLADFGRDLAPMLAYFPTPTPKNRDDLTTPRAAARSDGQRAFVFINNYQRTRPLPDQRDFQVALQLPDGTIRIPRQPTTIPTGVYTHWPVNLDLGGVPLEYATAELVCRLADPATFVFSAWPGVTPEFAFPASAEIEAPGARLVREDGHAYVDGLKPGTGVAIRVALPGGRRVEVVVLTREQALSLSKAALAGRDRLVLSPADVFFDRDGIHLGSRDARNLQVGVFPALGLVPASFRDGGADGIFQTYASTATLVSTPVVVDVKPVKDAAPSVPVKVSPKPRAVAIEPADADFDRAAVWRLTVPADALAGAPRTFLQIAYEGDVARVYAGGRFDNDNFYKGTPWELALWRYSPPELAQGLELKILPLRSDAPIYLPPGAKPEFPTAGGDVVRLKSVKVVREYQVVLPLATGSAATPSLPTTVAPSPPLPPLVYAIGADLSFLKQAEERGPKFKDGGVEKPGLQIFRDHGYNWIRLRLFHTPKQLPNNLAYTLALAREAKALGLLFLLDFHYSDTWADPGKQFPPKAWEGKTHPELVQAVFAYTRDTIAAFRDAGAMPDMVQIGNEITPGMLWPDGKLPENWGNFAELIKAGTAGVDAGRGPAERPRIMIHIEKPCDRAATQWFFDRLLTEGVAFDVIGQSYYPWWHGTLLELRDNLAFMAGRYHKDIILVEVAYNWKPAEYRGQLAPFPETPGGQKKFLEEVNRTVLATPEGLGKGVFWWEPAVTGPLRSRGMFDDEGNALPVISVFDKFSRGKVPSHQP